MYRCLVCISVCVSHACLVPTEGVGSPGCRLTDGSEQPSMCWESNLGSLGEQQVLLPTESSFHF